MKDNYRRCLKRREKETASGSARKVLSKCLFFNELVFLRDILSPRETTSHVNLSMTTTSSASLTSPVATAPAISSTGQVFLQSPASHDIFSGESDSQSTHSSGSDFRAIGNVRKRRNDTKTTNIDALLARSLMDDIEKKDEKNEKIEDSDVLFCQSLVSSLKTLNPKKNKLARIKLMEVLYELED